MSASNKEILGAIAQTSTVELNEKMMPLIDGMNEKSGGIEVYSLLENYPSLMDQFISGLVNRIGLTVFHNKVFKNPLKELHCGEMPFGATIQDIFVKDCEVKGIKEHFKSSGGTDENDLIGTQKPEIISLYSTINQQIREKVSIPKDDLKYAFTNQNGLSNLISSILSMPISVVEEKEYEDMKNILISSAKGQKLVQQDTGKYDMSPITDKNIKQRMYVEPIGAITSSNANTLVEKMIEMIETLRFRSDKYNMAKVKTFSKPEDLVVFITPKMKSIINVNVMATAFNLDAVDVKSKIIVVDELPTVFNKTSESIGTTGTNETECYAILADKTFIKFYDTVYDATKFDNGATRVTNYFLHKHSVIYSNYFANAIAFIKEDV